ncbi:MAG: YeaC family protein [Thalassotalea sp.]
MDIVQLVENLSDDMYERLKHAAETGRWPEGTVVDEAQKASALQIVMAYQSIRLKSDENMTVGPDGQIVNKTKRELKAQFSSPSPQEPVAEQSQNVHQTPSSTPDKAIARFTNL